MLKAFVRIFKVIALLGFALPWFAVSCSGQKLIEARGYELAIGAELKPQGMAAAAQKQAEMNAVNGDLPGAEGISSAWAPKELQYLAAGAAALLVLGLIAGFFLKGTAFHGASAAIAAIAGSLAAATYALAENGFKAELAKSMPPPDKNAAMSGDPTAAQFDQMAAMAQGMFQFTAEPGLWITVGGCVTVVLIAIVGLTQGSRPADASAAPRPAA